MKTKSVFSSTLFFTGASVFARAGGFFVQIVLGWVLVKEQYGLFAIALSIAAIFSCMRNGGTDQIIIQRGKEFANLAPRIASFSLLFNICVCLLFLGLSETISSYYGEPKLDALLIILAFGYLFATPGPILVAQLSIQKKFRQVAIVNLITVLTKHGLTVLLALTGFGVFSLLVPLAMQPMIGAIVVYFFVKKWPGFSTVRSIRIIDILGSSIWVIASNLAFQLSNNMQYFILGGYFNAAIIGTYFFAVQIINSPIALINNTVKGVVFPTLSNIHDDVKKYNNAIIKSIVIAYSIGGIIGLVGFNVLPYVTDFVWQGKWNESIIFVELLCFFIPSSILINTIYEILASSGFWKDRFFLLMMSTLLEASAIFLVIGGLEMLSVVTSLLIFRIVFSFFACLYSIERVCGRVQFVEICLLFFPFSAIAICILVTKIWGIVEYDNLTTLMLLSLGFLYYLFIFNRYMLIDKIIVKWIRK